MHASVPFPATFFSVHFVHFFSRIYYIYYSFIFSALSRKKKKKKKIETACARAQAAFLRSSGHSVKEIAKSLKKTERRVNNWSKRQAKEGPCFFFLFLTNFTRNLIERAKYIIQKDR